MLARRNTAGLIPVDMLSLNATQFTVGAVTGNGVTSTSYTFDPNAMTNAPVNVANPGSTTGLSIATDQSTITATNVCSVLGGMQAGDSIWEVAATGKAATDALGNGILSGKTSEVYQKPLLLNATPTALTADQPVGVTPFPEAMGTINMTSLLPTTWKPPTCRYHSARPRPSR